MGYRQGDRAAIELQVALDGLDVGAIEVDVIAAVELYAGALERTGNLFKIGFRGVGADSAVSHRGGVLARVGFAVGGILGLAGAGGKALLLVLFADALKLFGSADTDVVLRLQVQLLAGFEP
ncbi:hypothetical protein D3C80_944750 [compost metagenome]